MGKPAKKAVPVYHTGPDGRIVRAPRTGDGYAAVAADWHVSTEAEIKAAAAKEAARSAPALSTPTKPGPVPVKE